MAKSKDKGSCSENHEGIVGGPEAGLTFTLIPLA